MLELIVESVYMYLIVLVLALLEIQIEGQYPWAEKLPTWRKKIKGFNKDISGYHFFLATFILLLFHLPFVFGLELTIHNEFKILSIIVLISVTEDFLWNLINPSPKFGVINFRKNYRPFVGGFIFSVPIDYYLSISISLIFAYIADGLFWWISNFIIFITITAIFAAMRYYKDLKTLN